MTWFSTSCDFNLSTNWHLPPRTQKYALTPIGGNGSKEMGARNIMQTQLFFVKPILADRCLLLRENGFLRSWIEPIPRIFHSNFQRLIQPFGQISVFKTPSKEKREKPKTQQYIEQYSVEAQASTFQRFLIWLLNDLISNLSSYVYMLIYRWNQSLWIHYCQIDLICKLVNNGDPETTNCN